MRPIRRSSTSCWWRIPSGCLNSQPEPTHAYRLAIMMDAPKPTIPGPDPHPKTPKFRLPPLACDAHPHIFGPHHKYPYAEGRPYTPPDAPLENFRALHKKLGIGRAV